jgi:hypothetical protein
MRDVEGGAGGGMNAAIQYLCFECGTWWREGGLKRCSECHQPREIGDATICGDCLHQMVEDGD